jgi:site-specific DNA-cytosine methylase
LKVLIACEYSGIVRDAFSKRGHDAWSCDILPTESEGNHIQGDVLEILDQGWDLMIAHPPCTHLTVTGARWFTEGRKDYQLQRDAIEFVRKLMDAPIDKIAIENPRSVISSYIRPADQMINPFQFGDAVAKATCLWLKNLPRLMPTHNLEAEYVVHKSGRRMSKWYYDTSNLPRENGERAKARSKFWKGIAEAMAEQWGHDEFRLVQQIIID